MTAVIYDRPHPVPAGHARSAYAAHPLGVRLVIASAGLGEGR
ncbi:hypothetical protein ACGFZB_28060 [Streptomyces cinerochromogenes]|uniref:Uncharacterized protein n=1 Tax=Streptomyces cinerochromogenes TaxID=66422 RepID=A0ABW7BAI7_9ACTN